MREPRDFYTTMSGVWASVLMGGAQSLIDGIYQALNSLNWGPLQFLLDDLVASVGTIANFIITTIFPGAPGAVDYYMAGPEALADVAGVTATTLVEMQAQRRYVQYSLIPWNQAIDQGLTWSLYYSVRGTAFQLYYAALGALSNAVNALYNALGSDFGYLARAINQVQAADAFALRSVYVALSTTIAAATAAADQRMDALGNRIVDYVGQVRDRLAGSISDLRVEVFAAIAALGVFVSTVVVPGALAAFKLEQTAEIAAGLDVLYPVAAASIDKTALQLVTTLPLVAARALDVPPEAVPGVGGMAEALAATTVFTTAVQDNACAPLWTKLHQFADDTADLDGVVSTVLLAGLVTAMVTAPTETATVVADVIAGPLTDVATQALSLVGLS